MPQDLCNINILDLIAANDKPISYEDTEQALIDVVGLERYPYIRDTLFPASPVYRELKYSVYAYSVGPYSYVGLQIYSDPTKTVAVAYDHNC